jgi:hypothetical protein
MVNKKAKSNNQKDIFTVRMDSVLYDKMQEKLKQYRKRKSINSYINQLIIDDLQVKKTRGNINE